MSIEAQARPPLASGGANIAALRVENTTGTLRGVNKGDETNVDLDVLSSTRKF